MMTRRKSPRNLAVGFWLVLTSPVIATAADLPTAAPRAETRATTAAGEVVYQGTIVPGARVNIGTDGPIPPGTAFQWTQVEGPTVAIDNSNASRIHFTAPAGASRLAFVMSVRTDRGERSTRVMVPISEPRSTAAPEVAKDSSGPGLFADGGGDQVGVVGRRVTLDGSRSKPAGRVGYRWIQLSGPPTGDAAEDGGSYSFLPDAPGTYRFALVVAHESRASVPDVVTVEVGPSTRTGPTPPAPRPAAVEPPTLAQAVTAAVAAIPRGAETADKVADVFDSVADRAPIFRTYGELQSEMTRRIDVVIPYEPTLRAAWSSQILMPLSQITSAQLLAIGIDPRLSPEASRPLEFTQKLRVQEIFKGLAAAFRPVTVKP